MNRFLGVRPGERRIVWLSFVTLLTIVAAHTVLGRTRRALPGRPARHPAPWASGIAVLAYFAARVAGPCSARAPRAHSRHAAHGATGTAVLWESSRLGPASLMALYIWTGVLASVVLSQFWIQLAAQMDVGQAKRAYALIAAGGMLGATVGSGLASVALTVTAPRNLVGLAAALFALSAFTPAFIARVTATAEPVPGPAPAVDGDEAPSLRGVWADPYLKRLLLLTIMGPVVAMGIDFVFKSIVSHQVPRAALAPFFARYNLVVNATALAFQLLVAPRLMQHLTVVRNLCLLPGCLGIAAAGVASSISLPAVLFLRGTDGVLRHSLHRAATEILFLPLSPATRGALRRLAETIGQRGGQVVGSLLILLALVLGATPRELAAIVAALCGLWLFGYVRLVEHYLERFRSRLGLLSAAPDAEIPELDLQSLETLVATLSAPKDTEVMAAMDLLETYGRARLVTPLILYHPSPAVVLRALALFDGSDRADVQEIRRRLLQHADPGVRAAALRAVATDGGDRSVARTLLRTDPSPAVRRSALVLWLGTGDAASSDLREAIADLTALADPAARLAVASALSELPANVVLPVARALLEGATPAVRREVARALANDPDEARMALLTELVAPPESRPFARVRDCAPSENARSSTWRTRWRTIRRRRPSACTYRAASVRSARRAPPPSSWSGCPGRTTRACAKHLCGSAACARILAARRPPHPAGRRRGHAGPHDRPPLLPGGVDRAPRDRSGRCRSSSRAGTGRRARPRRHAPGRERTACPGARVPDSPDSRDRGELRDHLLRVVLGCRRDPGRSARAHRARPDGRVS
jgi:AAA family ATP:ADP antiporter